MKVKLKDVEAEKIIIAGIIKDSKKTERALLTINGNYFSDKTYENFFKIVVHTYTKHGSLVTNDLISNYLESAGFDQVARLKYLKELDELVQIEVNDAEFALAVRSVKSAYVSNAISDILVATTHSLENSGGNEALKTLDKKLYDLKVEATDFTDCTIVDTRQPEELIDLLRDMREHPDKYKGMPCGWSALDTATGGFRPDEYVLVLAKTGSGKSMVLLNWANNIQKAGHGVVFFTLEMPHVEVQLRRLSLESGIPFINLKTQNLTVEQIQKQEEVLRNEIGTREAPFHIVDIPKSTVGFIEAQVRQLRKNMRIDVVFIDYLGLLKPEAYAKNSKSWEVYGAISQDLRELARTLKITVISAHQINAEGMKKKSADDIELEDVSVSKAITHPAQSVVGVIWDKTNPNEMKLCVPKCRGSRIENTKLWCDMNVCKITDMPYGVVSDSNMVAPDIGEPEI